MLGFALYYMLVPSVFVFAAGASYRIVRMLATARFPPAQRRPWSWIEAIKGIIWVFLRPIVFVGKTRTDDLIVGLILLHVVGVIPVLFLLAQHMSWWVYYFPPYKYLWIFAVPLSITSSVLTVTATVVPTTTMSHVFVDTIWGPLTAILNGDLLAIFVMVAIGYKCALRLVELITKHSHTPRRLGDFIAYALLFGIIFSGYVAARHRPSPDVATYMNVLGLHVLLAEILLMYIPFSKYWHFVFGYWYGKLHEWYDTDLKRGEAL
ncbi:hypothetical protein IPA_00500 [Ignicoccus pacificus DSM 13166]|uniref:Nitrate reductase n=1 Tax=Ignicoccus pacificus DSM 13166 TaxID=940294 RepID=A0A977PJR2_9CREN|nr:hypothetical protein IPA_00500 [Ignicoccus pacificus DSM 13166]